MAYSNNIRNETLKSITDVNHVPFWLDDPTRPAPGPELTKSISTDLLIIGAGFTGLWTALLAKEENPSHEIVILEAGEVASGASGRLDEIEATIKRLGIECDYLRTGELSVASELHQVQELKTEKELSAQYDLRSEFYDHENIRDLVKSPLFIAGLIYPDLTALVNPAQLAWGLGKACLDLGVRLYEHSAVTKLEEEDKHVSLTCCTGDQCFPTIAQTTLLLYCPCLRLCPCD